MRHRRLRRTISLLEITVSTGLFSLVALVTGTVLQSATRLQASSAAIQAADLAAERAIEQLSSELRLASAATIAISAAGDVISFQKATSIKNNGTLSLDPNGPMKYAYIANSGTIELSYGTVQTKLVSRVTSVTFSYRPLLRTVDLVIQLSAPDTSEIDPTTSAPRIRQHTALRSIRLVNL